MTWCLAAYYAAGCWVRTEPIFLFLSEIIFFGDDRSESSVASSNEPKGRCLSGPSINLTRYVLVVNTWYILILVATEYVWVHKAAAMSALAVHALRMVLPYDQPNTICLVSAFCISHRTMRAPS